ncbi:8-amino-7-oxononanoate synthase [Saccharopolyspora sp. 5N708]|uniref:8-amino-7-oxononanoate synthase n=1 Tax=Saccharopolyspora sp. 5N708 TaxID=3457424 RepID=UPI003FD6594B
MPSAFDWIDRRIEERHRAGLTRTLRPRGPDDPGLDLASNDYLGLARDPRVVDAAATAARRWGAGSTGSRLVTGTTSLHGELEERLADFCGAEAALVFSSGYTANLAAITALTGPSARIVSDQHNHASLIDGCRLSGARTTIAAHANPETVRAQLSERALVVTESVFSVDGDVAPLPELHRVCREHDAGLLVDDAHGLGVIGPGGAGALRAAGLPGEPDVVATVTLSKSLGAQGGAVLGPRRVIRHLTQAARTFVFDTGLAPACAAAALAALEVLRAEPQRADRVQHVARLLHKGLSETGIPVSDPGAAVLAIPADSPDQAVEWAARCRANGIIVGCFRPPSVPDTASRLRLTARADLTNPQITHAIKTITKSRPTNPTPEPRTPPDPNQPTHTRNAGPTTTGELFQVKGTFYRHSW